MKNIQLKYNFLQILYWLSSCTILGYVAVFLQYKGLSNTQIGIVTGFSCLFNMIISPNLSGLLDKYKNLTIKKLLTLSLLVDSLIFLLITFIPMSKILIMILYVIVYSINVSLVPFLSTIAMDYLKEGIEINFGLARGFGSIAYASSAFALGYLTKFLSPLVLSVIYFIGTLLFLLDLYSMPSVEAKNNNVNTNSSLFKIIKEYPLFFMLLLGFSLTFAASTTLATYLINIVKNLGGDTSFYGIAVFCMAASEMPIMALAPRLMKKYNSVLLIMIASIFYVIRNFVICLAPNLPILLIGMACQSLSYALTTGVITYYVTFNLKQEDHIMGQTMIAVMTTGLGSMIGNVLGGVLSDALGINAMLIFACAITVIGTLIILMTGLTQKEKLFSVSKEKILK